MGIQVQPCCCDKPAIYWLTSPFGDGGLVKQTNFDNINTFVGDPTTQAWNDPLGLGTIGFGFAPDGVNGQVYYLCEAPGARFQVHRANVDGTNQILLIDNFQTSSICLNASLGFLGFLAESNNGGVVQTANMDGTGLATLKTFRTGTALSPTGDLVLCNIVFQTTTNEFIYARGTQTWPAIGTIVTMNLCAMSLTGVERILYTYGSSSNPQTISQLCYSYADNAIYYMYNSSPSEGGGLYRLPLDTLVPTLFIANGVNSLYRPQADFFNQKIFYGKGVSGSLGFADPQSGVHSCDVGTGANDTVVAQGLTLYGTFSNYMLAEGFVSTKTPYWSL